MSGPYFSELKFLNDGDVDILEVAADAGTDVSGVQIAAYNPNGTTLSFSPLARPDHSVAGRDVYVIDDAAAASFNGVPKNGAVALTQDSTVISFVSFAADVTATQGPAVGMTSRALGTPAVGESLKTSDNGASYTVKISPGSGTAPCFLAGTNILTNRGYRPVESLLAGDRVATMDQGMQPVLWVGSRKLGLSEIAKPEFWPICLPAGSLMQGVPNRDLYLSPDHCVTLNHPLCSLLFDASQILAPARALIGYRGIGHRPVGAPVTYYHLLFASHQVIWANGQPSESFYPERISLRAFSKRARAELNAALPDLAKNPKAYGPTARQVLQPDEVRVLLSGADTSDLGQADAKTARTVVA